MKRIIAIIVLVLFVAACSPQQSEPTTPSEPSQPAVDVADDVQPEPEEEIILDEQTLKNMEENRKGIHDFESCAAAGNPIMESYPRQCRYDGNMFAEEIDENVVPDLPESELTCEEIEKKTGNCPTDRCYMTECEEDPNNPGIDYVCCRTKVIEADITPTETEEISNEVNEEPSMELSEAMEIAAQSECLQEDDARLTEVAVYNENTRTWWIDLELEKANCAPACVVNVDTNEAVINWRCTGALVPE